MSRNAEEVQRQAEEIRRKRLESAGLVDQYDMWRESMPEARIPDNEVYDTFIRSQVIEDAAVGGRLSVSTGGEEDVLGTDIPTPGPDAEGDSPDEAGDTSEGEGDRDTDLKLVEGMWQPPEESQAENYNEPSTYQMSRSKDWIRDAKIIHKFMNPEGAPIDPGSYWGGAGNVGKIVSAGDDRVPKPVTSDGDIGEWMRGEMSGFNWNIINTMNYAQKIMSAEDPKVALAFLNLINMYDHSDGGAAEFFSALGEIATDPTTYVGLGAGAVAAKGVAIATAKTGLKKAVQVAIMGGTAGAIEGGMIAGGFDLTVQNVEQEAGAREDIDYGRAGKATGAGVALGTLLGTAGGHFAGRKMDKLAAATENARLKAEGGEKLLTERGGRELSERELEEMFQMKQAASKKTETRDPMAKIADRVLNEDGELHRLEDGSIDWDRIDKAIKDVRIGDELDRIVTNTNYTDIAVHLERKGSGLELTGTFEHYGPIQDVAEEMGLGVASIPRKKGFFLRIEGTDAELVDFMKKIYGPETPAVPFDIKKLINAKLIKDPEAGTLKQREGGKKPEPLPMDESRLLQEKIIEMKELEMGEVVIKTANRPGSKVTVNGVEHEIVGRTKNGWYHLKDNLGRQVAKRRKQFDVVEKAPAPLKAGPMELDPFSKTAAKIISMNEDIVSGKLTEVKITHAETADMVKQLKLLGIDIKDKQLTSYWTHVELMALRDDYNAMAKGMGEMAVMLRHQRKVNGVLTNAELALFNQAHTQFVATRDLFYGTSGNAARQLNILRSKPTGEVYDFSQSLMDSIAIQGGRANTERAINLMADFARVADEGGMQQGVSRMSQSIWGNKKAAWLLNLRYNMMLSSWRTHFYNLGGNTASGVYHHLMVSPMKMGINNINYARQLAWSKISGNPPDPADRLTRHQWYAELHGHYDAFSDSLILAKEIAMGRDIGEGKVWNELGLRYNIVNVPTGIWAKMGTTPVRALEAGDAFFKNQYYNSKIYELSSIKARYDEVHNGWDYQERYKFHIDNPEIAVQDAAKAFAAKQTYTNDPNIYGGIFANLAKSVSALQNKSMVVNMIVPFIRTPANLMMYSMETIGVQQLITPSKTYNSIRHGTQQESQEALARLTIAAGLWLAIAELHQNGKITGTGPSNFEERKIWEAAGWQANSVEVRGKWYDISRAAPAGQSLATIASVYDFYAMTKQQDKPTTEWIGAGLLYTADMILDESYLSTASDLITAIASKEESRARSNTSSMITSILVPNLLRDLRRPTDEIMRSTTSVNLMDQVHKQMMNASPWHSAELPPKRDWKGNIMNYYGNAYVRGLIPFNIRDPEDSDMASMALAYARIPVSIPSKSIAWPGGNGDGIDLFAMDTGDGYIYDRYLETVGRNRGVAVNILIETPEWKSLIEDENVGPGSEGEGLLKMAISIGSKSGRLEMLNFLIEHSGDNNTYQREYDNTIFEIHHQVSVDEYIRLREMIRNERLDQPEDTTQYKIKKRTSGPEFFKP